MIMLGAGLINMFKVPITAFLNSISAWWHMVGVIVVVFVCGIVPDHHKSVAYVFGQTINNTGFGGQSWTKGIFIYVFLTGLLMAQYTITGYDASAHMSEETKQASRGAAWGMVMSVVVSVVFGFILLVAVTFAIPLKGPSDTSAFIVQHIWRDSMGRKWAEFLIFIAVIAQSFCTIASTTSASRMMFAFSRDRAVPGHQLWRRVS
jgi:amino acid transporter